MTALAIALGVLLGPLAVSAQQPQPAKDEKPSVTCPCEAWDFKPLTEKGRLVVEYWRARRHYKGTLGLGGILVLLFPQSLELRRDAEASHAKVYGELSAARAKAEAAGALKVGDDLDGPIEFKIVEGVDYSLPPRRPAR